jgi:protein Mpv17
VHTYKKPTDVPKEPIKSSFWNKVFGKYLLVTNTVSSGILMMAGDMAAQKIEYHRGHKKEKEFDWYRIGKKTLNSPKSII